MSTSVPQIEFTPTGLVLPEESAILAGVQADWNAAFGGNMNPALNTPQGQAASSEAAVIANTNALFALFVNQVDPDTASGFMQDAIGRIYFLNRLPGAPTVVTCTLTGASGTPIPLGAQAQDTSGNIYVCTGAVTIPSGGSINTTFANVVNGPIPCAPSTLTKIYQQIAGWDSITNASAGVVGNDVESQAQFAYRMQQSVAVNAHSTVDAIFAAVFEVPDVLDVYVIDNPTGSTVDYGSTNYPITAHSVYVGVVGGSATAIAQAIWSKKDLGCNMVGNTTEVVQDLNYSPPYPSYNITFNIPTDVPIFFDISIINSSDLPSDIVTLVKNAIIATFTGTDGSVRAKMGATILAATYYAGVINTAPPGVVQVTSILLGTSSPGALTNLTMGIDQEPTITAANITVNLI